MNNTDLKQNKNNSLPKEELLIKSNVKNPILKELLNRIEDKYGCLLTNTGYVTNGNWLSVKAITVMISELDNELKLKEHPTG